MLKESKMDTEATSSEITIDCTPAKRFISNIEKMRNPHIRDYVSLSEKYASIEDYSEYQEQKDLESYRRFLNSFAYDDIKEIETQIGKKLALSNVRKIGGIHDN